jgi:hypothetical protein
MRALQVLQEMPERPRHLIGWIAQAGPADLHMRELLLMETRSIGLFVERAVVAEE